MFKYPIFIVEKKKDSDSMKNSVGGKKAQLCLGQHRDTMFCKLCKSFMSFF